MSQSLIEAVLVTAVDCQTKESLNVLRFCKLKHLKPSSFTILAQIPLKTESGP